MSSECLSFVRSCCFVNWLSIFDETFWWFFKSTLTSSNFGLLSKCRNFVDSCCGVNWLVIFGETFWEFFKIALTSSNFGLLSNCLSFFHSFCVLFITQNLNFPIPSSCSSVTVTLLKLHFRASFKQNSVNSPVLIPVHGGWIAWAESNSSFCQNESLLLRRYFIRPKLTIHSNTAPPFPEPLFWEMFSATCKLSVKYTPGPRRPLIPGLKPL